MTIFLSIHYHNEIAVTLHPETKKRVVVAKTRSGPDGALTTTYSEIPETGTVRLYIKAEPSKYSLGYAVGKDQPKYTAEVQNRWLQAFLPGWQVFTGSFFGIYSTAGIGLPMLVPAVGTPLHPYPYPYPSLTHSTPENHGFVRWRGEVSNH